MSAGAAEAVEQCVLRMDIMSLDLNQASWVPLVVLFRIAVCFVRHAWGMAPSNSLQTVELCPR